MIACSPWVGSPRAAACDSWLVSSKSSMRSSCGTPSISAITCRGSSTATSWTKSHDPRSITESMSRSTRSAMLASRSAIIRGTKTRWTMPRTRSCSGGSMPRITPRSISSGTGPRSVLRNTPPAAEEKVSWSRLTASMSRKRVSDQNPGSSASGFQCTGASARIRAKSSYGGPSANWSRSLRSTPSRSTTLFRATIRSSIRWRSRRPALATDAGVVVSARGVVDVEEGAVGADEPVHGIPQAPSEQGLYAQHRAHHRGHVDVGSPAHDGSCDRLADGGRGDRRDEAGHPGPGDQVGPGERRHDAGEVDTPAGELDARRLRQGDDRRLGGAVRRAAGNRRPPRRRGDVEDVPPPPLEHPGEGDLHPGHAPHEVDVDHSAGDGMRLVEHGSDRHDPGVVHEHVERADLALDVHDECGEGVRVGDVESARDDIGAERVRRRVDGLLVDVADRDPRATAPQ